MKQSSRHKLSACCVSAIALAFFGSLFVFVVCREGEVTDMFFSQSSTARVFLVPISLNTMMLALNIGLFGLAERARDHLSEKAMWFLRILSFSSYCVFLFHRPVLYAMARGLSFLFSDESYGMLLSLVVFGLPLVFALSYVAQVLSDKVFGRLITA
jgi:hypothetical protein